MKIDKVANIAVIVVAAVFIGTTIYDRLSPRVATPPSAEGMMGKTLSIPKSVSAGARVTVALFVSPNCHFCTESMPFYARVAALRVPGGDSLRVLGFTRGSDQEARQYVASHGVSLDGVSQMEFSAIGVPVTPTVALLDSSHRIIRAWTGKLSRDGEEAVVKAIQSLRAKS